MDISYGVMDYFSKSGLAEIGLHCARFDRLFPSLIRVVGIGIIPRKRMWMDHQFANYSFSFILRGEGSYQVGGRTYAVQAPCVITQRHGEHFHYGPAGASNTWDELFITIDHTCGDVLRAIGFIDERMPMWRIGDPHDTIARLDALAMLICRPDERGAADRIDRAAEAAILASLLDQRETVSDPRARAVQSIAAQIERNAEHELDVNRMIRAYGLAPSTFRRAWQQARGESPHRFQDRVRMRRACRLLIESQASVADIATQVGYQDPLYFSRRFKLLNRVTASQYRQQYQARSST